MRYPYTRENGSLEWQSLFLTAFLKIGFACLLLVNLSGCGTSSSLVKKDGFKSLPFSKAFAKALNLGQENSSMKPSKPGAYPPIPLEANEPRVRKFLREYAYEKRNSTRSYLAQSAKYIPMVTEQTQKHGLPQELAYLFLLESGANPDARSPANALGMWQFMPATARSYGLRVDSYVDERLDPDKSTNAALIYLKDLYGMFGCWRLALSAYNSGENKLDRVLCKEDANEYEDICSSRMLRRETKEFLPRFQALAIIAKNPKAYGFMPLSSNLKDLKWEIVPVQGSYSLDKLAQLLNISYPELLELNPALVRGLTPPEGAPFSLRVPVGKKDILLAGLEKIQKESPKNHIVHVVKKGDNLTRITKKYGVSKEMLAQLNPDVNMSRRLKSGATINVPKIAAAKKVAPKIIGSKQKAKGKSNVAAKKS
ncbi:MAG: transglycosylase SLT domain-containing protein [Pseudomonadota bacterium]